MKRDAVRTLYTLGYGNLAPDTFYALLPSGALVVDVRAYPDRARLHAFTRAALASRLGRDYLWVPELGNPSRTMPPRLTDQARGLARLQALLAERDVCLLCAEGAPYGPDGSARCHRVTVSELARAALPSLAVVHVEPARPGAQPSLFG